MIHIRDFAFAAWEEARYTRHRVVAFDRKFKDVVAGEVPDYRDPKVRQKAVAERLAEHLAYRPRDIGHLIELEDKVMEAADDVTALLKRTPAELAYNKALERNIDFHKDLEFPRSPAYASVATRLLRCWTTTARASRQARRADHGGDPGRRVQLGAQPGGRK